MIVFLVGGQAEYTANRELVVKVGFESRTWNM